MIKREIAVALAVMLGLCGCKEAKAKDALAATDAQENIIKTALPAADTPGIPEGTRVKVDENNFPDEKFRNYISENIDTDHDGKLDAAELNTTREINVNYMEIDDLTGIEYFTKLELLYCAGNNLDKLDLSCNKKLQVLCCNPIYTEKTTWKEADAISWVRTDRSRFYYLQNEMENNSRIKIVRIAWGELKELDVTQCPELEYLDCGYNQLTHLDISNNPSLKYLNCRGNHLTALSTAENQALVFLDCGYNQLTNLDISNHSALKNLICGNNGLKTLTVNNNPSLETLDCSYNKLKSLDVSSCPTLKNLRALVNELTSVDLSETPLLEIFICSENYNLEALDVSQNPDLKYLICPKIRLKALDLGNNPELVLLDCPDNELADLDVSACSKLSELICYYNGVKEFDFSHNPDLSRVVCDQNDEIIGANSECEIDVYSPKPNYLIIY